MIKPRLPIGYLFSQHSLNTFHRCRRRFWLRYVARVPWPVPQDDEPLAYEEHLERGRVFHQWIQRDLLGLPVAAEQSPDEELRLWWQRYKAFDWSLVPSDVREAEFPVIIAHSGQRLYARYDLVALDHGGQVMVVDWKTLGHVPSREVLEDRMQTRVYLFTLARVASELLGGEEVPLERISMLYWFANRPDEPVIVPYDQEAYRHDAFRLTALMNGISLLPRSGFAKTRQMERCAYCNYRTLCQREALPKPLPDAEDDGSWLDEELAESLDLDDIPEVPY